MRTVRFQDYALQGGGLLPPRTIEKHPLLRGRALRGRPLWRKRVGERRVESLENINLDLLPKDGGRILRELSEGKMVVTRSKNDFLYILDFDGQFHMFSHTTGAPGGGQRQFPKDEKHIAIVRKLADISDAVYMAEFDKGYNLYAVMYTAEEAILEMFPGEDRDADGIVDFGLPDEES